MAESIYDIGRSIQIHRQQELTHYIQNCAIGRVRCDVNNARHPERNGQQIYWLVNNENLHRQQLSDGGETVYKNTRMGELLSKYKSGTHDYEMKGQYGRVNRVKVEIFNRSLYKPERETAKELIVHIGSDGKDYRFQYLSDLLNSRIILERQLEEKRQQEEEELDRLQQQIAQSTEDIRQCQSFIHEGNSLREQHILEAAQIDARDAHLYDGVPLIIEGGPGTGKTTTVIQRLKFLISKKALEEHDTPLTDEQMSRVSDPMTRDRNWLFFSPTEKLLMYLRQNMIGEDLRPDEDNTTILPKFSKKIVRDYMLWRPETDGPFKLLKKEKEFNATIIKDAHAAIVSLDRFCVTNLKNILTKAKDLDTSSFFWDDVAQEIKNKCGDISKIKTIEDIINLFNRLHDNENRKVQQIRNEEKGETMRVALYVKNTVLHNQEMKIAVSALFDRWDAETIVSQDDDAVEDEMDEGEDEETVSTRLDFELKLFQQVQPILRKIALRPYDSKAKLSKRQSELYALIKAVVDTQDLSRIGELAWFNKNYAFLCRGVESNLLNQIPRLYKLFRKEQIKMGTSAFDTQLLDKVQKKDGGKRIYREELEMIVGFINHILNFIHKRSRQRFESMKRNQYVEAYCSNVKYVIGVDEATDYSLIDYYFISSFQHYEFSTLTLSGDIMQGLNDHGIRSWNELTKAHILPQPDICQLNEIHRQSPVLMNMSKAIYKDVLGKDAPYYTTEKGIGNAAPLYYVSDDIDDKAEWIVNRIVEVINASNAMPSIGIFVGDNVDVEELKEALEDQDHLSGIDIVDCTDNKTSINTRAVRVFRISEVKGMEFEASFFYDIDDALAGMSTEMMSRYLYVGVSRATNYMAVTFTKKKGNEGLIKYFDETKKNWKL